MKKNLSHYFSTGRFARWPIWKAGVSALLAVAITGTVLTTTTGAAVQALAPKATATPEPTATPVQMQEHLDTGWLKLNWTDSGISPAKKQASYKAAVDLSSRQQNLYIEVYATNTVTRKTSLLKDVPVQVVMTCAELTKIKQKENKHDNPASELNANTAYDVDPKTGKLKIENLNPGKYAISLQCTDSRYTMPKTQYVTVKEHVDYKKDDTTAKQETAADAKEDQAAAQKPSGEEVVVAPPQKTESGWGFLLSETQCWSMPGGDAKYLYAADGTTKTPYRIETKKVTGADPKADGKQVQILDKAVFDKSADQYLYGQAAASNAAEATGLSAAKVRARVADPLRATPKPMHITLLAAEGESEGGTTPEESETINPETPPAETPEENPSEKPEEPPVETPVDPPVETPEETPAETPVETPTQTPTETPTATPTATPTPEPTPVPQESYTLFSPAGDKVEGMPFALPAPIQIVLSTSDSSSNKVLGIDVSKYQPNINWKEVKESGVEFVIIRMGYRGYGSGKIVEDPYFRKHLQGAKAAGLKVGIYFFSQAVDEKEAVEEASACLNAIAGQRLDYPIFFDSEYSTGSKTGRADGLSKGERTACAIAFCETIRNGGYRPGVYASSSWFNHQLSYSALTGYTIWNAHYGVSSSPINCHIWQYTGNGRVNGVYNSKGQLTAVDVNISYMG